MKKQLSLTGSILLAALAFGQGNVQGDAVHYDSTLAKKLGADDYGMKVYVMVVLKNGGATMNDMTERNKLTQAHKNNMDSWMKDGKLLMAGPFMGDDDMEECFILKVKTFDDAKRLTDTDPAIEAGLYYAEFHMWYGPAALQELSPLNEAVEKKRPS